MITKGNTSTRLLELGTGSTAVEAAVRVPLQLAAGSPAAYAELAGLSTQRTLSLSQGLVDHFNAIRKGLTDVPEDESSAWTSAYGSWHKQSANASIGAAGYNGNTWGDLLGVEKRFGNLVAGVLAAAGQSSATFSSLSGNVSTDSWHAGGYATLKAGKYVLESGAFFGVTDNTARRSISAPGMLSQQGRWKPSGNEWLTQIGLTRPIDVSGKVTLTPSLRLLAQGQSLYAANESNLGGLEVATRRQQTYSVHHQAGVEARRSFKLGSKAAAAALQLDWLHDYRPEGRSLRMALAGDSAATYGYRGSAAGADAFHVGASFEMALTRRATVRLTLDYQAQSEASVTRGALSLGYSF